MDSIETVNDMLIECVKSIGVFEASKNGFTDDKQRPAGSKFVGSLVWPEKTIKAAQTLLLNCLNEDRPEKLTPDQAYFIIRLARERNIHVAINFMAEDLGYTIPSPLEPKNERDEILKEVMQLQKALVTKLDNLESLKDV